MRVEGPIFCETDHRREQVRQSALNGIDFVEVSDVGSAAHDLFRRLEVHFLKPDGLAALTERSFEVLGGERIREVRVIAVRPVAGRPDVLRLEVDRAGDFSEYTLRIREDGALPAGFDPILAEVGFWFRIDCAVDQDCKVVPVCVDPPSESPQLDYLAKDYRSFRALMLDRLSLTLPEWTERNPADLGVTIVEALAFAADKLSYRQDEAATEAYLSTARLRSSLRRHARLLDYRMHSGCNARAWVCFEVDADLSIAQRDLLPARTLLFASAGTDPVVSDAAALVDAGAVGFETVNAVRDLRKARNGMVFHTWMDADCCLPPGATRAFVKADASKLGLSKGDVVVLEELAGRDGRTVDRDPSHRQAVRLVADPVGTQDPVQGQPVTELRWGEADALRFALQLDSVDGKPLSVVRGNVVLADHGITRLSSRSGPGKAALHPEAPGEGAYRPRLDHPDLTHRDRTVELWAPGTSAVDLERQDPRRAEPECWLFDGRDTWTGVLDLLNSGRFDLHFVAEVEQDGFARLRFGDDRHGRRPVQLTMRPRYRTGNGRSGNVGAGALSAIHAAGLTSAQAAKIKRVWNPMPALGGVDPEPMSDVRLYAPHAFREQRRAVTERDYETVAEAFPGIQKAVARRRWTGSWTTIFLTVDRMGGKPVDPDFERALVAWMDGFRMAGYDLEVEGPVYVSIEIVMTVCVEPGHFPAHVRRDLNEAFTSGTTRRGEKGFFHPDRFTFGQALHLSDVVAAAMAVPGVRWVDLGEANPRHRFQRMGEADSQVDSGSIEMDAREIVRLDNDPNAPEKGRLEFRTEGGA